MKITVIISPLVVVATCSFLTGCASIVSGRHADVAIDSYPSNAHVVIQAKDGREVASVNTPGVVSLKRNRRYFLPAKYTAIIAAPGYEPAHVPIRSTLNPWILGNVVIGGVPGLIVDNATGAAWKPRHSEIHHELAPLNAEQGSMYSAKPQMRRGAAEPAGVVADRSAQVVPASGSQQGTGPAARY